MRWNAWRFAAPGSSARQRLAGTIEARRSEVGVEIIDHGQRPWY
jgi:hypothetical protein